MSHFTVMVVTDTGTQDEVSRMLDPYHEFECTGRDDEYVQDVDITEDVKKEFAEEGHRYPNADIIEFYEEWYGCGVVPEGETPFEEDGSIKKKCKFGYYHDGKFIDRTNPNRKWDWWAVGGRWMGMLRDKNGKVCDTARVGDLDLERMKEEQKKEIIESVENYLQQQAEGKNMTVEEIIEDLNFFYDNKEKFESVYEEWKSSKSKMEFVEFATTQEFNTKEAERYISGLPTSSFLSILANIPIGIRDPLKWVREQEQEPFSTFAFLDENGWNEKGEMGWFASVSNEKDDWGVIFSDYLKHLLENSPEKYVTIVDCHI